MLSYEKYDVAAIVVDLSMEPDTVANDETVCEVVSGLKEEFKVEKNDFVDDVK